MRRRRALNEFLRTMKTYTKTSGAKNWHRNAVKCVPVEIKPVQLPEARVQLCNCSHAARGFGNYTCKLASQSQCDCQRWALPGT